MSDATTDSYDRRLCGIYRIELRGWDALRYGDAIYATTAWFLHEAGVPNSKRLCTFLGKRVWIQEGKRPTPTLRSRRYLSLQPGLFLFECE